MMTIRPVTRADAQEWLRMRRALWRSGPEEEHRAEIELFFDASGAPGHEREPHAALLALDAKGAAVGFAELSLRAYAESCHTRPVAYLEGWYVEPEARGQGVGRALVEAAEDWGREQGCREFASDSELPNEASRRAHRALGFEEVGVIRCYRKEL